jgi:hypothetical protein
VVRQCWCYISATVLRSADRPALEWSKRWRPEPFRRACLMRSAQKSVVAVCACSVVSEVHLLRPAICLFAGGCICRGAVDASPVCPWERFTSFGASECSDLICPARFTRRTHVVSTFCPAHTLQAAAICYMRTKTSPCHSLITVVFANAPGPSIRLQAIPVLSYCITHYPAGLRGRERLAFAGGTCHALAQARSRSSLLKVRTYIHPAPLPLSGALGCPALHHMHVSAKPESCASVTD